MILNLRRSVMLCGCPCMYWYLNISQTQWWAVWQKKTCWVVSSLTIAFRLLRDTEREGGTWNSDGSYSSSIETTYISYFVFVWPKYLTEAKEKKVCCVFWLVVSAHPIRENGMKFVTAGACVWVLYNSEPEGLDYAHNQGQVFGECP